MFTARALASLHGGGGRGRGHGVGGDVGGIKIEILKLPLLQITSNYLKLPQLRTLSPPFCVFIYPVSGAGIFCFGLKSCMYKQDFKHAHLLWNKVTKSALSWSDLASPVSLEPFSKFLKQTWCIIPVKLLPIPVPNSLTTSVRLLEIFQACTDRKMAKLVKVDIQMNENSNSLVE